MMEDHWRPEFMAVGVGVVVYRWLVFATLVGSSALCLRSGDVSFDVDATPLSRTVLDHLDLARHLDVVLVRLEPALGLLLFGHRMVEL